MWIVSLFAASTLAFAPTAQEATPPEPTYAQRLAAATSRFDAALAAQPDARAAQVAAHAEELLALAASAPATREALDTCLRVVTLDPGEALAKRAIAAIVGSGAEPRLLVALSQSLMRGVPSRWHEPLLEALVAGVEQRDVQGYAAYALGHLRLDFADDVAYFTDATQPEAKRAEYAKRRGAALLADHVARGADALRSAGLAALHRVVDDFYFADHRKAGYLGALADAELFELEHLQVGMVAPEIEGVDEDGVPFKLSDYRGKVVLIDFWGYWCPICVHNLPGERKLVDRLKDQPFALVGINSDPKDRLAIGLKHEPLSWRSFFDGGDPYGPIASRWNVTSWPTMYVLDDAGVIRAKGEDLDELERAVDALLVRAGGAGAPR